jgi:hypothetical protein
MEVVEIFAINRIQIFYGLVLRLDSWRVLSNVNMLIRQILQWASKIITQKVIALVKMLFLLFRNKYWNTIKKVTQISRNKLGAAII